jgi:1-acyl-sn-glycerol-3-phosphate acyltransferase
MLKLTSILKLVVLVIWTIVIAVVAIFSILLTLKSRTGMWIAQRVWTPFILFVLGVKMKVKGLENIDPKKNYIILANHTSNLDIPMLSAGLPMVFYYVAKKELQRVPFLGWGMMAAGVIFIDRKNKSRAIRSMRIAARKINKGKNIMIFPEGTFDGSEGLLPFKKGAFHLAMQAQTDILPVAIVGADTLWPEHTNMELRAGLVELRIGKVISVQGLTSSNIKDVVLKSRLSIENLIQDNE